jgi:hypothetical protein
MPDSSDEARALLIEMREYVFHHGILIGECVAWDRLKEMHGVGLDRDADLAWVREYRARKKE